jgi:SAM-dependent methyltransferase
MSASVGSDRTSGVGAQPGLLTNLEIMTSLDLKELAARSEAAALFYTGFADRQLVNAPGLQALRKWLLNQCGSSYMKHSLSSGLGHWSRQWEYPYILAQVARHCSCHPASAACDNACGDAAIAYLLASAGLDITGTDLNEQLSTAWSHPDTETLSGGMRFQPADSHALPFDNARFDVSYCISSLEHMRDPVQAINEMIRVTKPGGLVTFTMDVAPYESSVGQESNVNRINFQALQDVLASQCSLFSAYRFAIPSDALSWQQDCKTSSNLRDAAARRWRVLRGLPERPDFYIFGGSFIKR